ncbi:hypothetical protein FZ983_20745 [Azospirillum sp. B21]|uniref:hypothetical protein n=1 Tax=Azospirillum sp. B21 TaxID=2607496 RepID=UPI0011EBE6C3|nr:hypothetical protein [Azospirillum sp. B21]KAA0577306.1 hypothetical protein FZ983_20745 [Azospirillum sp. B21]
MGGSVFEWIGILLGCAGLLVGLKPDIINGLRRRSLKKSLKSLKKITDLYAKRRNFTELAEKKPVAATANLIRLTATAILFAAITAFFSYSIPDYFNIILGMTSLFFCVKFINEVAVHALDLKEPERLEKISSDIKNLIEKSSSHLDKMSEKDKKIYEEIKEKF